MNKKKKNYNNKKQLNKNQLELSIYKLLKRSSPKALNIHQISSRLKSQNAKGDIKVAIRLLIDQNKINKHNDGRYSTEKSINDRKPDMIIEGKVDAIRSGAAYIISEDSDEDVFVPAKYLNDALDGDTVKVGIYRRPTRRKPEGKIIKIIKRGRSTYIGSLRNFKNRALVFVDHGPTSFEVVVPPDLTKGAKDFEKVSVNITEWNARGKNPYVGEVVDVLGEAGTNDVEMQAILLNAGFELNFSEEAMKELDEIKETISDEEIKTRRDLRDIVTFTIDPEDAKDFDDALSIEYKEDGLYEIGVHIADVSHYVVPDSHLDKEALERGNSVYLVDRVLPMLPERISNGLCSLRPNEEKRCFSAIFTMDSEGKVLDKWMGKTLIYSDKRFSYEEAQEVMDSNKGPFVKELNTLNGIARKLRKKRYKNGSINFESEELRFKLDENGKPISLYIKERLEVHQLIEDFMLLANRTVAAYIGKRKNTPEIPFVYRVHDLPDMDKVQDFALFAKELGFEIHVNTPKQIASAYNRLTEESKTNETLKMLQPLAIRTMSKAIYTTENNGHFGLGFEYYSHFTSPIRRYADLLVHRLLEQNLTKEFRTDKEQLEKQCQHISAQERKAQDAERESTKYKQVEYISQFVGQEFAGRISGMIDRGIFVELTDSLIEGMVSFESMEEPYYLEESRLKAVAKYSNDVLKMGDIIQIRILSTDIQKRQIEMEMVE